MSLRLGSPGHITRVGHPRAAGGLRERLGGQVSNPPGARGGLALISSCGWSHGNKGTSWGSFSALLPCMPQLGETGSQGCLWGRGLRIQCPVQLSPAPPGPCVGGDSPKLLPAHPEAELGVWFPKPAPPSPASGPQSSRILTQTLVGSLGCAPGPRVVLEEGQAALTVRARGVVLASAGQPALPISAALAGVPVALAPGKRTRGQGVCNLGEAPAEEGLVAGSP